MPLARSFNRCLFTKQKLKKCAFSAAIVANDGDRCFKVNTKVHLREEKKLSLDCVCPRDSVTA